MVTTSTRRRFSEAEYRQMEAVGIFKTGEQVALIDGEITLRTPEGMSHPYRFTASQYELLGKSGILDEDDPVELIRGEIVVMSAAGARHMRCVDQLNLLLARSIPDGFFVHVQSTVYLDSGNVPEPDLAVILDRGLDSPAASAADTLLVIEVSDSTLVYDQGGKRALYAAAGIPEYWLVNLPEATVTRYTAPQGDTYTQAAVARAGEVLPSTTVPAIVIPVADILR